MIMEISESNKKKMNPKYMTVLISSSNLFPLIIIPVSVIRLIIKISDGKKKRKAVKLQLDNRKNEN